MNILHTRTMIKGKCLPLNAYIGMEGLCRLSSQNLEKEQQNTPKERKRK